ncbi:hypothetical protein CAOG_07536 [Capsaspora owczarzaki ATCC 30864]|uniref:Ubiquitin carboxyl-terminal hydrolase n=1 Tax=Capsaspora owczarzaki (strain ATCC 30864) TaxID=595528 RepID=A0A0D2WWT6_CAPO3|nr:hypothetical protein CAOG_07536 [Capsaspora owczarzaki ATCC 30864]KJE97053.1 hypothetical protein CAOG_007536 [Capsaspora owczarzaki ATCC 30864]KJE97054.1 hypothetical protein, variant [Capsaspora owczarzaki ATCC 30864]|eukprot:XP_004343410.1 hypothetical protein CAOG_07536 [Capsaspora owczarzaki ATCC 30864]
MAKAADQTVFSVKLERAEITSGSQCKVVLQASVRLEATVSQIYLKITQRNPKSAESVEKVDLTHEACMFSVHEGPVVYVKWTSQLSQVTRTFKCSFAGCDQSLKQAELFRSFCKNLSNLFAPDLPTKALSEFNKLLHSSEPPQKSILQSWSVPSLPQAGRSVQLDGSFGVLRDENRRPSSNGQAVVSPKSTGYRQVVATACSPSSPMTTSLNYAPTNRLFHSNFPSSNRSLRDSTPSASTSISAAPPLTPSKPLTPSQFFSPPSSRPGYSPFSSTNYSPTTATSSLTFSSPTKTFTRNGDDKIGLENQGNDCYLNAMLQALLHLPLCIQSIEHAYQDLNSSDSQQRPLTRAMLKLVRKLHPSALEVHLPKRDAAIEAASSAAVKMRVGDRYPSFGTSRQQDAHELLTHVLTMLEYELSPLRAAQASTISARTPASDEAAAATSTPAHSTVLEQQPSEGGSSVEFIASDTPSLHSYQSKPTRRRLENDDLGDGDLPALASIILQTDPSVVKAQSPAAQLPAASSSSALPNAQTDPDNPIKRIFSGLERQELECLSCKRLSESTEEFYCLSLELPGPLEAFTAKPSLDSLLHKHFTPHKVERTCEHCGFKTANRTRRILRFPNVLAIHLMRFRNNLSKLTTPVNLGLAVCADNVAHSKATHSQPLILPSVPEPPTPVKRVRNSGAEEQAGDTSASKRSKVDSDNLSEMTEEEQVQFVMAQSIKEAEQQREKEEQELREATIASCISAAQDDIMLLDDDSLLEMPLPGPSASVGSTGAERFKYRLVSVVHHHGGSIQKGHYTSHVLDFHAGRWYECNDERVTPVPLQAPLMQTSNMYMCFFVTPDIFQRAMQRGNAQRHAELVAKQEDDASDGLDVAPASNPTSRVSPDFKATAKPSPGSSTKFATTTSSKPVLEAATRVFGPAERQYTR